MQSKEDKAKKLAVKVLDRNKKAAIRELCKIEKKYGIDIFRSACSRKLRIDKEMEKALKTIKAKEAEVRGLKKGKLPKGLY